MNTAHFALYFALASTLVFNASSLVFAEYAKRVSVMWMNCFKSVMCFLAIIIVMPFFGGWHQPSAFSMVGFFFSGFVGLNIADIFLLTAFTRLGASRTLILFGFQPLMVGVAAYFIFDQPLNPSKFIALIFLIGCLFTLSLEKYRTENHWEIRGLIFAIIGVAFDAGGILLTRAAFESSPFISSIEGQFWRCLGALAGFGVIAAFRPFRLIEGFLRWPPRTRALLVSASLGGTFVSLLLYLTAIKVGHLASIASISITGPMFSATLECFIYKKRPSRYLLTAFALFAIGFYILTVN